MVKPTHGGLYRDLHSLLRIVSQKGPEGWGRCPPHYHLPSQPHFWAFLRSCSFIYICCQEQELFFWKERDRRRLFSPRLSHSVSHSHTCLLLYYWWWLNELRRVGHLFHILHVSPMLNKSCTSFLHSSTKLDLKKAVQNDVAGKVHIF